MIVALLNRWASLQHISVGLARACGWPKVERAPVLDPSALTYFSKAWDDLPTQVLERPATWKEERQAERLRKRYPQPHELWNPATQAIEWKDAEPILAASELGPWPEVPRG